ncbi:MAG: hypothetical protein H7Y31_08650, partial [Chitinophagaceae bacterium]|nr:hypothetical protein [Chitinophagaceae bacterium]
MLKSTRDWHVWYGSVVTQATQLRVWDYINPESEKELQKPTRPQRPASDAELSSTAELLLKMELEEYKEEFSIWTRADTNIASMRTFICSSVDPIHISDLASTVVSPRDILKKLKNRLCPTDRTRATEILNHYEILKKPPKTQDLEKWIYEWMEIVRDGKAVKQIEEEGAKLHFYRANAKVNEALADSISLWEETLSDNASFEDIANKFLNKYREKGISSKTAVRSAFATSTSDKPSEKPSSDKSENKPKTCLCGDNHAWKVCFYIVPSIRPQRWKGDENIQKKVDGIIEKNPRVKSVVGRIRKLAEGKKEKSQPTAANHAAETLTRTTESEDEKIRESFVTLTSSMSLPVGTSNSTFIYPLKNSFTVDNASHLHVCNMKERFLSLTICDEPQFLLTGDSQTAIMGFGDIWVKFTKTDGSIRKVKLQNAAYIPSFHTNLISTAMLREYHGVCLNERDMELQFIDSGDCAAKLQVYNKMIVAEYIPASEVALATGSNFPSPISENQTKKSAAMKPTIGTNNLWSGRLGHPSEQAIAYLPLISNVEISDLHQLRKQAFTGTVIMRKQRNIWIQNAYQRQMLK